MPRRPLLLLALTCLLNVAGAFAARAEPPPAVADQPLTLLRRLGDGTGIYATAAGRVALPSAILAPEHAAPGERLRALIGRAAASGTQGTDDVPWRWVPSVLTGGYLTVGDGALIALPSALLKREGDAEIDRAQDVAALEAAVSRLGHSLRAREDVTPWMRGAVIDLLERLARPDGNPAVEELDPGFARRIVATGTWLERVVGGADGALREAVVRALTHALRLTPHAVYAGDGIRMERLRDAWAERGWVLYTPAATVYVRGPVHPMDAAERMKVLKDYRVRVVLPAGSRIDADPSVLAGATSAALVHARTGAALATWDSRAGFQSDARLWHKALRSRVLRGVLRGGFPPHIVLAGPDGRLSGLAVPGGLLRPVRDGSPAEAERFLADATRLLPDAPYLDLIQQYLVRYAWDSPEVTEPLAVGCRAFRGEIHQTAAQILETCAGGVCRGDCDDIAEFIQVLAARQGKLAHAVSVPAHVATVWAEKRDDGWHAFVLQAGPAREFVRPDLPSALGDVFRDLDPATPVDLGSLVVSLRFFGQNTRADFGLSWRIFADRTYAETLIDIQQDWHRYTLLVGVEKMLRLIAAGERDSSSYGELASLYSWSAQPGLAVDFQRASLAHVEEPESRLVQRMELVARLIAAERGEEARALAEEIVGADLPQQADRLGLRALTIGLDLADTVVAKDVALAAHVLARTHDLALKPLGGSLYALMTAPDRARRWSKLEDAGPLARLLSSYAWTAVHILEKSDGKARKEADDLRRIRAVLQPWIDRQSMDDVDDGEGIARRWALHARLRRVDHGPGYVVKVLATPLPRPVPRGEHARLARSATDGVVRAWARVSPQFATGLLWELTGRDEKPSPADLERLADLLDGAVDLARRYDLDGQGLEQEIRSAHIVLALLRRDPQALRPPLREVRRLDDRSTYDDSASAFGAVARHLDLDWWRRAVRIWIEEVDNRPSYFDLAWQCVRGEAVAHGLHVADEAAKRFPGDAAMVREAQLMHALLDGKAAGR